MLKTLLISVAVITGFTLIDLNSNIPSIHGINKISDKLIQFKTSFKSGRYGRKYVRKRKKEKERE